MSLLRLFCFLTLAAAPASAQCPSWSTNFRGAGLDQTPTCMLGHDDGSGPALFVGGPFTSASGLARAHIARWNGVHWDDLAGGLDGTAFALCGFDDGTGNALYVGGGFTTAGGVHASRLARWKNGSWTALAGGDLSSTVLALCVFDDGTGPALYAAGSFTDAGGVPANRIARWNGASWTALGSGTNAPVHALAVHDDGGGAKLYAGGEFTLAGGVACNFVASWDGASWQALGSGLQNTVECCASYDEGSGARLFVGGSFLTAGGQPAANIARWDGSAWSVVGSGLYGVVNALTIFDDGSGPKLAAAKKAQSDLSGNYNAFVMLWDGASWGSIAGFGFQSVSEVATADLGQGVQLYAAGGFLQFGTWNANHIARVAVGPADLPLLQDESAAGFTRDVRALAEFQDGVHPGPSLYAGGDFEAGSGHALHGIGRWDGAAWQALGAGTNNHVIALQVHDDGSGTALWVGGDFTQAGGIAARYLARWDGANWSVPTLVPNSLFDVRALLSADLGSGPRLYVAGMNNSTPTLNGVICWDGSSWSDLGGGLTSPSTNARVLALAAFDDGSGPALYAGGDFQQAGGQPIANLARWDGANWTAVGSGFASTVSALKTVDLGSGPALYAGAEFISGPMSIARWDGASWLPMAGSLGSTGAIPVRCFAGFDAQLGQGRQLWVGFDQSLLVWTGSSWTAPPGPSGPLTVNGQQPVRALLAHDDGSGHPGLWIGGGFTQVNPPTASLYIARYETCNHPGTSFCFGDGLDPQVSTRCPCANFGSAGHGCANSIFGAGGLLRATGSTLVNAQTGTDSLVLQASSILSTAIFLQGSAQVPGGAVFGDGVRCAGGQLIRLGVKGSSGGAASYPGAGDLSVSQRGAVLPGSGAWRCYQAYYRNPDPLFCPAATFNITNGILLLW